MSDHRITKGSTLVSQVWGGAVPPPFKIPEKSNKVLRVRPFSSSGAVRTLC